MLLDRLNIVMTLFCPSCKQLKARQYFRNLGFTKDEEIDREITLFMKRYPQFKKIPALFEMTEHVYCCNSYSKFSCSRDPNKFELYLKSWSKNNKDEANRSSEEDTKPTVYSPDQAYELMIKYDQHDIELIGLKNSPPVNMVMDTLPVAPRCIRPTIVMDGTSSRD